MIPETNVAGNVVGNVKRFSGFEDEYDRFRPAAPRMVVDILTKYLDARPSLVIDVGCGTGLSSFIWLDDADRIVGVEPSPNMSRKAQDKLRRLDHPVTGDPPARGDHPDQVNRYDDGDHHNPGDRPDASVNLSFVHGYSNQLHFAAGAADIVTCSQSFHWMEPSSTLQEVARVLRKGGVFAAYDCDWPPTVHWEIEQQYVSLLNRVDEVTATLPPERDAVRKWSKEDHLANMIASKAFRFTKEIVFHDSQPCDAQRYVGLALSQGGLQAIHKVDPNLLSDDIAAFRDRVEAHFRGRTVDVIFSYRMRVGVK